MNWIIVVAFFFMTVTFAAQPAREWVRLQDKPAIVLPEKLPTTIDVEGGYFEVGEVNCERDPKMTITVRVKGKGKIKVYPCQTGDTD